MGQEIWSSAIILYGFIYGFMREAAVSVEQVVVLFSQSKAIIVPNVCNTTSAKRLSRYYFVYDGKFLKLFVISVCISMRALSQRPQPWTRLDPGKMTLADYTIPGLWRLRHEDKTRENCVQHWQQEEAAMGTLEGRPRDEGRGWKSGQLRGRRLHILCRKRPDTLQAQSVQYAQYVAALYTDVRCTGQVEPMHYVLSTKYRACCACMAESWQVNVQVWYVYKYRYSTVYIVWSNELEVKTWQLAGTRAHFEWTGQPGKEPRKKRVGKKKRGNNQNKISCFWFSTITHLQ